MWMQLWRNFRALQWQMMISCHQCSHLSVAPSSSSAHKHTITDHSAPQHNVWLSTSCDIHSNLALEEWIFKNLDLSNQNLLLLWRNNPCVVIGRHQNPWLECDLATAKRQNIAIARRCSGGGTVYHDLGNMCVTFFTNRTLYNRKYNLELVSEVLRDVWDIPSTVTDRDDILLQNKYKISGTAARLAGQKTYHHFTLLLNVDMAPLHQLLNTRMKGIVSKATESVRSEVFNLQSMDAGITYDNLCAAISQEFMCRTTKQGAVQYVNPDNSDHFPGLNERKMELKDWNWLYGKTPKFTISEQLQGFIRNKLIGLQMNIEIDKGLIKEFRIEAQSELKVTVVELIAESLMNVRFTTEDIDCAFEKLYDLIDDKDDLMIVSWIWQSIENIFK